MKRTKFFLIIILGLASFLRLWRLNEVPVSLFGDELDVGYQAYSILKTGKDYSGNVLPLHFHSIAEWRTPLYLYSAVPTVGLFGISPLGVRLPASLFGILGVLTLYFLTKEILSFNKQPTKVHSGALLAALILALSPWHIQYSRAGFEVTFLVLLLLLGLYFFFKSLKAPRFLWISLALLIITAWVYSTAKLFTPILIIFLFTVWRKEILKFPKHSLAKALIAGLILGLPVTFSTIFGGGTQRAGHLSVFTDPTVEPEVGYSRLVDAKVRGEISEGINPKVMDRLFHNKVVFWTDRITSNYFTALSSDFLFNEGDLNLRHSPKGIGQFFKIEFLPMILGLIFFVTDKRDRKIKLFLVFWLIAGTLPSAITRDGGNHATRLILILPPLVFLISYGMVASYRLLNPLLSKLLSYLYLGLWVLSFGFYIHDYYVHYPWDSERWWHAGFKESIQSIKDIEGNYDKIIFSMAGEPAWIFFAGWYRYPPDRWQKEFPIGNDEFVDGFGKISRTGKFYFGTFNVEGNSIYDLPKYIGNKTLYVAVAKEVGPNLLREPEKTPPGLTLVKAVPYPSGEPAFYLFTKG